MGLSLNFRGPSRKDRDRDRIEGNGVRTVVVEDASRLARDLVAQELGVLLLIKRDVRGFASALTEGHPRLALMAKAPLTRRACNQ
jgi:hypothetical protein